MAITRRESILEKSISPIHENPIQKQETQSQISKSEYEKIREQRIKENTERFEKLGILNISLKLNAATLKRPGRPWMPVVRTGPRRRSSRLSGETPLSYWETEVYNEKHEKLLGNTEKEWILCVDGYGPDGRRIYDPVNGKSCHQCRQKTLGLCRQKTLGLRTHCTKCQLVTGQFCGDCLYTRYGEHIVEANENPNWICPPCRGICNCNFCRKAKGWRHAGNECRMAKKLGFKSVAHYLIKTKRTPPSSTMAVKKAQSKKKRYLPLDSREAEVYNEKHEMLLGNTEKEWTLCVDGYGPHGSRLYDPLNGKTCHQCRLKTLGLRTHCNKCQLVTGQFCGDCLYMRYGEHVVEANENPNWICPPCRGICNCSLCRRANGWPPTGLLYQTAKNLGFKSVAHYLIKTKRTPPSSTTFDSMEVESNDRFEMELNIDGGVLEETRDVEKESVVTCSANSNQDSTAS